MSSSEHGSVHEIKSHFGHFEHPKKYLPFLERRLTTSPGSPFLSGDSAHVGHIILSEGSGILFVVLQSGKPEQAMNRPNLPLFMTIGLPQFGQTSSVFS